MTCETYGAHGRLSSRAALSHVAPGDQGAALPRAWFVTDPDRTPDPSAVARRLPPGTGVIYRHFGDPKKRAVARALIDIADARGLMVLVANDPALAWAVGAHGVHAPERRIAELASWRQSWRRSWRDLNGGAPVFSAATHSARAARAARQAGADLILVSPVFDTRSAGSGRPLGVWRAASIARAAGHPAIAMGGVGPHTQARLEKLGFYGWAGVDAWSEFSAPEDRR